jgi:NADPH-dependent 2,4-dienoyl-CoA reductase/sulfur reductase-like enzyme
MTEPGPAEHIVVVGASLAGLRTVQGLRRKGSRARITLIGDEPGLPYDRPPLSKAVLLGTVDPAALHLADAEALAGLDVDLRLGLGAAGLDLGAREVRLADGTAVPYDRLVIATGSSPRRIPGLRPLAGVHVLRTAGDAAAIRAGLLAARGVAVVGGGFIGAEIASAARKLGLAVTVVDALPTLMTRGLGPRLGERMTELHRRHGVTLRLGCAVADVVGDDRVTAVALGDGSVVPADLVVVGIGTVPNIDWLRGSGVPLDDGVRCDEHLRAAPGVYAVGDVARWHNPHYDRPMRMEHWTSAGEQATALAGTLTGTPTPCAVLPYVWSDQFGRRLQIFGRIEPDDDIEVVFAEGDRFVALARRGGALEGAVAYDAIKHVLPYRMQLARAPVSRSAAGPAAAG